MSGRLPPELQRFLNKRGSDADPATTSKAVGLAVDIHSATWAALEPYLITKAEGAIERLKSHGMSPEATEFERGYLAAMESIIKLPYDARNIR